MSVLYVEHNSCECSASPVLHRGYAVQEQGIHSARNGSETSGEDGRPLESRPGLAALGGLPAGLG